MTMFKNACAVLTMIGIIIAIVFMPPRGNTQDNDNQRVLAPEYGAISFLGNADCQRMFNPDLIVGTFEYGTYGIYLDEPSAKPIYLCQEIGKSVGGEIISIHSSPDGKVKVLEVIVANQADGPAYNQLLRWHQNRAGELELAFYSPAGFPFREVEITNKGSIYFTYGTEPRPASEPPVLDGGRRIEISDDHVLSLKIDGSQVLTLDGVQWFATLRTNE